MRKHFLDVFQNNLVSFFNGNDAWAFTESRLHDIIEHERTRWGIPYTKGPKYIIDYLKKRGFLFSTLLTDKVNKQKEIYSWKTKEEFTVISGLKTGSFFSYYSAIFLHGLTLQVPKTYYLNVEHASDSPARSDDQDINQEAIDKAFAGEQRKSLLTYTINDKKVIVTNSKKTGNLGVIHNHNEFQHFDYTDLERTLIDCSVRPAYAGGVFEVLEAYKMARKKADIKKMDSYLQHMDYIYPYHQVIGFYLEKAGYDKKSVDIFDREKEFNFYLTYHMRSKEFSERWKLYYPKGF